MVAHEGRPSEESRRAARALVASYHQAELAALVEHLVDALERYRVGECDVYEVDDTIHRYHKATQELWKFCFRGGSGAYAATVAPTIERLTAEGERLDWWTAAEGRRRG